MEIQNLLLAGLGTVTSALCFICRLLWKQVEESKADRDTIHQDNRQLRKEISDLNAKVGNLQAYKDIVSNCRTPGCMFRPPQPTVLNAPV